MKFEENIRELRKQQGLSQEELADKLEVSRQAVSKWENGSAYPELDKLLAICEIFHCKIDDLLQGSVKIEDVVSKEVYDAHERLLARAVTIGVSIVLFSMSLYCYVEPRFIGTKSGMLNAIFMGLITIAIMIFIYFGLRNANFYKKYGKAPMNIYTQDEKDVFERRFRILVMIATALILLGVALYDAIESAKGDAFASGTFMLLITISAAIFVYQGMNKEKIEKTESKPNKDHEEINRKTGLYCGCIMMVTAIVYLLWSFIWSAWEISWLVFPIGGILCGIVSMVLQSRKLN